MKCVTSVSFGVTINGKTKDTFSPSRGLRQGDPFSPYLFLCVVDVLSNMISQAVGRREVKGLQMNKEGPIIPHLLFGCFILFGSYTGKLLKVKAFIRKVLPRFRSGY